MPADLESTRTFLSYLPSHAHILDVGCGSGKIMEGWKALGFEVEGVDEDEFLVQQARTKGLDVLQRDLRLLSPKKEFYDAVWCHQSIARFTIEECHRILGSLFTALRPRTGILFISFLLQESEGIKDEVPPAIRRHTHSMPAFLSLLRQSGFTLLLSGSASRGPDKWAALFSRRS